MRAAVGEELMGLAVAGLAAATVMIVFIVIRLLAPPVD
jgi:hypothetical protein